VYYASILRVSAMHLSASYPPDMPRIFDPELDDERRAELLEYIDQDLV